MNDFIKDDERDSPPGVGEYIVLPNNYLRIGLESLTVGDEDLKPYTVEFRTSEDLSDALSNEAKSSENVVKITTNVDDGLVVRGADLTSATVSTVKTKEVTLYAFDTDKLAVIYKDDNDNKLKLAGYLAKNSEKTIANIDYGKISGDEAVIKATYDTGAGSALTLKVESQDTANDAITMSFGLASGKIASLGTKKSEDEADELKHNAVSIGSKDNDLRTKFGMVIEDPESNGNDDRVRLLVPSEKVEAQVAVNRPKSTGTSAPKETSLVTFGETDKEGDLTGDLILVGGPAVNPLSAKYLGVKYPDYGTTEAFPYENGEGLIKVFEADGKKVILVAGYSAEDSMALADKLIKNEGLSGELALLLHLPLFYFF